LNLTKDPNEYQNLTETKLSRVKRMNKLLPEK